MRISGFRACRPPSVLTRRGRRLRRRSGQLQDGQILRRRLDRHHRDDLDRRRDPQGPRLHAEDHGSLGSGHLRVDEEQGHRRVPRQLAAVDGERPQALYRGQVGRRDRRQPARSAPNTPSPFRNTPTTRASRISATSPSSRIRSRARSSASSPATTATACPRPHQGRQVRPQGLPARRIERAGHAGRSSARHQPQGGRRLPRLGAASDERQFQDPVPDRRRRQFRAEFRRRHRLHQRARRLRRRVPERRQAHQESCLHRRYRERRDEQDPDRRQGRPGRGEGMAEDQPARNSRPGSTA